MTDGGWSSSRLETTYREARAVLEAQNETVADIDDKAMRTVRITAIVIGLLVSAIELAPDAFDRFWIALGGSSLLLSLVVGVLTYGETDLYLGPTQAYIEQLRRGDFETDRWGSEQLDRYSDWLATNSRSSLYPDPGPEYRRRRRRGRLMTISWEQDLLATYGTWIEENSRDVVWNGQLLLVAQSLLLLGICCTVLAIAF